MVVWRLGARAPQSTILFIQTERSVATWCLPAEPFVTNRIHIDNQSKTVHLCEHFGFLAAIFTQVTTSNAPRQPSACENMSIPK